MPTTYLWQQELQRIADESRKKDDDSIGVTSELYASRVDDLQRSLRDNDLNLQGMVDTILEHLAQIPVKHRRVIAQHLCQVSTNNLRVHQASEIVLRYV
jgi:hypothetical protein